MQNTASAFFGSISHDYDSLIRRTVPRYDAMIVALLDYLPADARRIVELGCGSGNLSLPLVERFPHAHLTFLDASPEMVELTRARIAVQSPDALVRCSFLVARFEDLPLRDAAYDLLVSSISLHHVRDKHALYHACRRVLHTPAHLCFSDQFRGATDQVHDRNWTRWLEFCRAPGNCTEEEVEALLEHAARHDHYTPLEEHFALLQEAGFHHPDCVWRNNIWGVVTAELP